MLKSTTTGIATPASQECQAWDVRWVVVVSRPLLPSTPPPVGVTDHPMKVSQVPPEADTPSLQLRVLTSVPTHQSVGCRLIFALLSVVISTPHGVNLSSPRGKLIPPYIGL